MSPLILIIGAITFLACFTVHVVWWRCKKHPKSDILALAMVFFVIPAALSIFIFILHIPFINFAPIALLHTALSCAYIVSYPAVQAGCPSLNILLIVNRAMPKGAAKEEIKKLLGGNILLEMILQKMIEEKLVNKTDDSVVLTMRGRILASAFIIFRSIMGIGEGKG